MMHRIARLPRAGIACGVIAAAFGLTACTGTYHAETDGGFSSAALASSQPLPIQVDGVVGGVRGDPLAQSVAAAMPADMNGTALTYAPCAAYTECPGDHLVWTFGPPAARPRSAYPPEFTANLNWFGDYQPAPNNVTVKAALFQNGNVVSSVSGQVDADNPDDPAFKALIASMSSTVLTPAGWLSNWY